MPCFDKLNVTPFGRSIMLSTGAVAEKKVNLQKLCLQMSYNKYRSPNIFKQGLQELEIPDREFRE